MALSRAQQLDSAADNYASQGKFVKASESRIEAALAYEAASQATADPSASKTLLMLAQRQRANAAVMDRKAEAATAQVKTQQQQNQTSQRTGQLKPRTAALKPAQDTLQASRRQLEGSKWYLWTGRQALLFIETLQRPNDASQGHKYGQHNLPHHQHLLCWNTRKDLTRRLTPPRLPPLSTLKGPLWYSEMTPTMQIHSKSSTVP